MSVDKAITSERASELDRFLTKVMSVMCFVKRMEPLGMIFFVEKVSLGPNCLF